MTTTYVNIQKSELTWFEKLYLPAFFVGLKITARHFFINLFLHLFRQLRLLPKSYRVGVTYQYPEDPRPLSSRVRTRHRLTQRTDGSPRCVACMLCETVCPAKCIYIIAGEHPDPNIEKYPVKFDIDLGVCVYCGYCVEVCPEDAIRMDTGKLDIAAYNRKEMVLDIHELLNPGSRKVKTPV